MMKLKELYRPFPKEQLKDILVKPLVIVTAPSGYGKTTFIRSFFEEHKQEMKAIWLLVGDSGNDEEWLWQKICLQLKGRNEKLYKQLKELGLPQDGQEMDKLIRLIGENIDSPCCVILDDFQECDSSIIQDIIVKITYVGIPFLHVLIISRVFPDIPYEELMLKGYCSVIDQQVLTLTREETNQIFVENGVELNDEELERLVEYTDGWIAAVYLTLLDYKRKGYFRLSLNIVRLLKTAIFDKFPPAIKMMLAKMSLFDEYTIEEARYVAKVEVQKLALQSMLEDVGFVHYNIQDGKYTIHALMRTVASSELDMSDWDKKELYNRDGQWQEQKGNLVQAIICYQRAGNHDKIFYLIQENPDAGLYEKAPAIFEEFYGGLSLDEWLLHHSAYFGYIYWLISQKDMEKGRRMYRAAADSCKGLDVTREQGDRLRGELLIIKALLEFNDLEVMNRCMSEAYDLLKDYGSVRFSDCMLTYGTPFTLHLYHRTPGELLKVVKGEKEYARYYMKLILHIDGGWDELYDAEYELITGNSGKALELARSVCEKARFRKQTCIIISAYHIQINAFLALGMPEEFEQAQKELTESMSDVGYAACIIDYELAASNGYAKIGKIDSIPDWIRNFNLNECNRIVRSVRSGCITYGFILINQQNWVRLDAIAEQMMMPYEKTLHMNAIMNGYVFKAIAALHLESKEKALAWLEKALDIAEQDRICKPFMDCSRELMPLLRELAGSRPFVKDMLPDCEAYSESLKKFEVKKERLLLTEREAEIMQLVKRGLHNNEIGQEMHIALVTVEKTLTNIYRKLGVSNRAAAVAKWGGVEFRLEKKTVMAK